MFGTRVKGSDKDKFGTEPESGKSIWAKHFRTQAPAQWTYIGWNSKRPVFASKKTRQALAQLIDYDQISEKVQPKPAEFQKVMDFTKELQPYQEEIMNSEYYKEEGRRLRKMPGTNN